MSEERRFGKDRRPAEFLERLSIILVKGALIGGFIVLFDIKFTFVIFEQALQVGSGFAPETKGMVLQSMLISGFAAVVGFWLGASKQGQEQAQSQSRIAEAAPSKSDGKMQAGDVDIEAKGPVTVVGKAKK